MGNQNNKSNIKKEEEDYSEWNMTEENVNINSNYNDISKLEIKAKIEKDESEYFDIFPNGNILLYKENGISIFEAETYEPIIKYNRQNISKVLILLNNVLLLTIKNEINSFIVLNISNKRKISEKKIKIKYNYNTSYLNKETINIEKLKNNRILLYYQYGYDRDSSDRSYCFIFYKYNKKKSNFEVDYETKYDLIFFGNIFPYELTNSFLYFGDYQYYYYSNPDTHNGHCISLFKNKRFLTINYSFDYYNIEYVIKVCFIFKKKYLIALLIDSIKKYEIKENELELICEKKFSQENYYDYLLKDDSNFYLIYRKNEENNNDYIFIEFDENINQIKEENITFDNLKYIYAYDKHIYLLSQNEIKVCS